MTPTEKSERLIEAASAILHAAPSNSLNAVVLNKILFYLDLATLRDQGETVTGNSYIAIQNGPVVAKYPERLIGKLEELGIARQDSLWNGAKPIVLQNAPTGFNYIDSSGMILVEDVTRYFADSTSRSASEFSHKNPGWQIAWNRYRREGKPSSINLQIAMQQIVEYDRWMEVPAVEDESVFTEADEGIGVDW